MLYNWSAKYAGLTVSDLKRLRSDVQPVVHKVAVNKIPTKMTEYLTLLIFSLQQHRIIFRNLTPSPATVNSRVVYVHIQIIYRNQSQMEKYKLGPIDTR